MDVNFNGSLWWHNILQLYRGKKCSAQIFAKGSHFIAYFVRLILSLGQGFSHNWHRHCQIWSTCQIGIAHPHWYVQQAHNPPFLSENLEVHGCLFVCCHIHYFLWYSIMLICYSEMQQGSQCVPDCLCSDGIQVTLPCGPSSRDYDIHKGLTGCSQGLWGLPLCH